LQKFPLFASTSDSDTSFLESTTPLSLHLAITPPSLPQCYILRTIYSAPNNTSAMNHHLHILETE